MYPKVLVISNNCFSKTDSNGRTLGNFFIGWPKDCLAQFYIQNSKPDFDYCNNFFRVTDDQALKAFKFKGSNGGRIYENDGNVEIDRKDEKKSYKKYRRNSLNIIFRNMIWKSNRWKKCGFNEWVNDFKPDVVLLQAGDFAFMFDLARSLAKKHKAKLVIYNSESYYFKKYDYFRSKGIKKYFYPYFFRGLRRSTRKAYKRADYAFYICDKLKSAYEDEFKVKADVVYTTSEIEFKPKNSQGKNITVSYCGNLGLKRHKNLIEIAEVLQEISPEIFLDVYGRTSKENVRADFENCKGIRYHGLIPYDKVKDVLYESDLLVHTESFDDFYKKDLEFAFSTKIADSLSCGTCFMIYAPENMACTKYLLENDAAYVVTQKSELKNVLLEIVENPESRNKYLSKAKELADKNHRADKNVEKFQSVLRSLK